MVIGAGEIAKQLRAFVALTEDPGSVTCAHMTIHNSSCPLLASVGTRHMNCMHAYTQNTHLYKLIFLSQHVLKRKNVIIDGYMLQKSLSFFSVFKTVSFIS